MRQTAMRSEMRSVQPTAALAPPVAGTPPAIAYNQARRTPSPLSNLTIGRTDDPCEQAADRAADAVMAIPEAVKLASAEQRGSVAALTSTAGPAPAPPAELGLGRGRPMPAAVRAFFEPRFGRDLSAVRLHTDAAAERSAHAINARAYTLGSDIVFGNGEYRPESSSSNQLLAHELAHVVQQDRAESSIARKGRRSPGDPATLGRLAVGHTSVLRMKPRPAPKPTVPAELLKKIDLSKLTVDQLVQRYDKLLSWYATPNLLQTENDALKSGIGDIGGELAKRLLSNPDQLSNADLIQRTADLQSWYALKNLSDKENKKIKAGIAKAENAREIFPVVEVNKMKAFFQETVKKANEGEKRECINVLRDGMSELYGDRKGFGMTPDNTIEQAMEKLGKAERASAPKVIKFVSKKGIAIKAGSGARPEQPETNIWDYLMGEVKGDIGHSVFGLSLMDGFHSVTLTVDNRDPKKPIVRFTDHTINHGDGWEPMQKADSGHKEAFKEGSPRGLDEYITYFIQVNWDAQDEGKKMTPWIRLWRLKRF